jgi:hypothetical protein
MYLFRILWQSETYSSTLRMRFEVSCGREITSKPKFLDTSMSLAQTLQCLHLRHRDVISSSPNERVVHNM